MKQDYTHITIILDRSGSMQSVRSDVVGGFNAFIEGQKKTPGECTVTLAQFDSEAPFDVLRDFAPLGEVRPLGDEYLPRATTPLYDAIGRGIVSTGHRLAALSEQDRPSKVMFVIITDGLENASREFNQAKVFDMIQHQREKYRWEFVYIGANQDAMVVGAGLGVGMANSVTYGVANTAAMMNLLCEKTDKYRAGRARTMEWTDEERENLK